MCLRKKKQCGCLGVAPNEIFLLKICSLQMPFEYIQMPGNGQFYTKEKLKKFLHVSLAFDFQLVGLVWSKRCVFKRLVTKILWIYMIKITKRIRWKRGESLDAFVSDIIRKNLRISHTSVNLYHLSYLKRFHRLDAIGVQYQVCFHNLEALILNPRVIFSTLTIFILSLSQTL
jgi:hypothetical protein